MCIHGGIRRPLAKKWEAERDGPFWRASAGKSCDRAVRQQQVRTEWVPVMGIAHENQDSASASILLDLWKAFEQILHGQLARACQERNFPTWLAKLQVILYRLPRAICLEGRWSDEMAVLQTALAGDAFAAT